MRDVWNAFKALVMLFMVLAFGYMLVLFAGPLFTGK
jgi:hypothetical protein